MFLKGLTMLGFANNGSNSAQESSPNRESNDSTISSDDFLADKPSTSNKMAENVVFHVHMAPEEAFEQGHMIDQKLLTKQTQN